MICFSQNFIFVQNKWEIFFWFFMKLIRYLFAQQIELLSVFDQIENTKLLLSSIEIIKKCRFFNEIVKKHSFFNENIKKHNFLTEIFKSFSEWHKIICNQSDFWLNDHLQWQHSNQTFHFRVCFSNTATVLSAHLKHNNCKLVDKH